jgi:cytochrome c5
MKKPPIILFLTILTACGTVKLAAPQQSDVDRVSAKYPGYNLSELNDGNALFQQTCDRCHKLKNPTSRGETNIVSQV